MERRQNNSWLVIPFYTDPNLPSYTDSVNKFENFLINSKVVTSLNLAVIDDGCGLNPKRFKEIADQLIIFKENQGKAYAIREGLKNLLGNQDLDLNFIIQYDGDGDQSYVDIPIMQKKLMDISNGNPDIPTLIIGDRYSEDLRTPPSLESVAYRQTVLMFFGTIAKELGFDGVRDWVSGARGYTRSYANEFTRRSKSSRYGLESEQLVIASLIGARVTTAPLTESRPRDPHTLTSKWLQNFKVYADHEETLRNRGKNHVVDLISNLVANLKQEQDTFTISLDSIGEGTEIHFTRIGDRYTAEIPPEYRARLFEEGDFPFTIRRTASIDKSY